MDVVAEAITSSSPGELVSRLVVELGMRSPAAPPVAPHLLPTGAIQLVLAPRRFGGAGRLTVEPCEGGTRVRLEGSPPSWPLSAGWGPRTLRRLLPKGTILSLSSPGSAG